MKHKWIVHLSGKTAKEKETPQKRFMIQSNIKSGKFEEDNVFHGDYLEKINNKTEGTTNGVSNKP